PAATAQTTGEIQGKVQSADGQPLAGVTVTLLHSGTAEPPHQVSDAEGGFRFPDLQRGTYVASATLEGYGAVTCPGVRIMGGLTRELRLTLRPADSGQPSACEAPQ
ncbi:MAG TPA: carboxypeptidase-like regulatory domain-containing protein, partial [Thermoanaerobaculia bacterium]|nr:carboxypeptidase-like regulatory domain-containing protein [Thermoanaerobaculia bacterium]